MKKKNDLSLKDAMQLMIDQYRLEPQLQETRIKMLWEERMGKTISTYTSKLYLRKNILYVTILSAPLKQELVYGRDKIKKMLNEELGEDLIQDVVIR
ncbi:MAG: DUF721 domain-containing protein [Saprospiraceae bacterium]